MKRTVSIVLLAALLVSLAVFAGCGKNKKDYKDNIKVEDLCSALEKTFDAEGLTALDTGYINGMMQLDLENVEEYAVKVNVYGTNINEYGVLKCADNGKTKQVKAEVEDYLQRRDDSWMPEYMPEEYPKLKNAECKSIGNYVIFAILGEDDKDALFAEAEAQLKN